MTNTVGHSHVPIYRVVRRSWGNPIDTAFSQSANIDNRWNTTAFPALYCCCSEAVARAIVRDVFKIAGAAVTDLLEPAYPQLVEIEWQGDLVDMVTEAAIASAGFAADSYPAGIDHRQTQVLGATWHALGAMGVLCRSASMARSGFDAWRGDHAEWSEVALYPENCSAKPIVLNRREDLNWL
jgi:RES domain-containing protein